MPAPDEPNPELNLVNLVPYFHWECPDCEHDNQFKMIGRIPRTANCERCGIQVKLSEHDF